MVVLLPGKWAVERVKKDSGFEDGPKWGSFWGNQAGAAFGRWDPGASKTAKRRDSAASEGCPGSLGTEVPPTSASQTSFKGQHGGLAPEFASCSYLPRS